MKQFIKEWFKELIRIISTLFFVGLFIVGYFFTLLVNSPIISFTLCSLWALLWVVTALTFINIRLKNK
jgi:hypothetical protein